MCKKRILNLFLVSLVFCLTAIAEEPGVNTFRNSHGEFFHLLFPDYSELKLGYNYQPETEEKNGPGEFELNKFFGKFEIPLPISRDAFFQVGLNYELENYSFKPLIDNPATPSSENFHKGEFKSGFGYFAQDDLLLIANLTLGLYSNLENTPDQNDFQIHGKGFLVYRVNPGSELLLGAAYDETFDEMPLYPLLGVRMLSNDGTFHLVLTIPTEVKLGFRPTSKTEYYLGGWISGERYRFQSALGDFNIQTQDNRIGVGIIQWFNDHINIDLQAGVLLKSQLEFKLLSSPEFRGDLDPGIYLMAALGFAL